MKTKSPPFYTSALAEVGHQQNLAMFFLDIKDFTPFTECHTGFDIVLVLRRLFQIFSEAIESHKGTIIDTSGDGLYAVFGFQSHPAIAVCNAVKARNRIAQQLEIQNTAYFLPFFNHAFEVGIGLHIGSVMVANLHVRDWKNLSVVGYPVNVASRLQDATRSLNNNFIVSQEAYRFIATAELHDMEK